MKQAEWEPKEGQYINGHWGQCKIVAVFDSEHVQVAYYNTDGSLDFTATEKIVAPRQTIYKAE